MTITINETRNEYTATSGQTEFTYTFKIFDSTDLNVYQTPAGQTANDTTDLITAYSVSGVGDEAGGTVTLSVGASVGDLITIVSGIPSSRTTDYQVNGDFIPATVNDDFDRVVSLVKQVEDLSNRSILTQESQQGPKPLSLESPEAGKFVRWNTGEDGFENVILSELAPSIIPEEDITIWFDTKADMIAATLTVGAVYATRGYTTVGDGGGAFYLIKTAAQYGSTPDELGNFTVNTDDVAAYIVSGRPNILQFGATEGSGNSSANFQALFDYLKDVYFRGGVHVPRGSWYIANVVVPTNITIYGDGKKTTLIRPHADAENGFLLKLKDNHCKIVDVGFLHNRSFAVNAIEIEADADINRWISIVDVHIEYFAGSAIKINSVLWESTFSRVHARGCGNATNATAVFHVGTASGASDVTNNVTFDRCFAIFPHYYGIYLAGSATKILRKIRILNCMIHGGTDEGDLTPFPYPQIKILDADNVLIKNCNLTVGDPTVYMIDVDGSASNDCRSIIINDNIIEPSTVAGFGIKFRTVKESVVGVNTWAPLTTGTNLDVDSTVIRFLLKEQLVRGGTSFKLTDTGATYVSNDYAVLSDPVMSDPVITGTPSISGAVNWAGQESVSAATSKAVTLPNTESDGNYYVLSGSNFNSGHIYATGKSSSGFTLNWPTSGTGVVWWLVLR